MENETSGAAEKVILRRTEVIRLGYASSLSQLKQQEKSESAGFPKPIRLGPRSVGFRKSELDAWLAARQPL